ncbi:hypothetical protein ACT8ZR_01965 [Neobacillus sp. M.A.Huq-85]
MITFEKGNILAIGHAIETNLFEVHLELLNLPSIAKVTKLLENQFMEVGIPYPYKHDYDITTRI